MNNVNKRFEKVFKYYRNETRSFLIGAGVTQEDKTITEASFLQQRRDDLPAICGNICGFIDALNDMTFRKKIIG